SCDPGSKASHVHHDTQRRRYGATRRDTAPHCPQDLQSIPARGTARAARSLPACLVARRSSLHPQLATQPADAACQWDPAPPATVPVRRPGYWTQAQLFLSVPSSCAIPPVGPSGASAEIRALADTGKQTASSDMTGQFAQYPAPASAPPKL